MGGVTTLWHAAQATASPAPLRDTLGPQAKPNLQIWTHVWSGLFLNPSVMYAVVKRKILRPWKSVLFFGGGFSPKVCWPRFYFGTVINYEICSIRMHFLNLVVFVCIRQRIALYLLINFLVLYHFILQIYFLFCLRLYPISYLYIKFIFFGTGFCIVNLLFSLQFQY